MVDEIDLNAFVSSPYSSDIKKQQKAFLSAQNIRKATESVEEYKARMAKFREEHEQKLLTENTDILAQRLANLDISNIGTKNRTAIENLIREAQSIKFFAYNNHYNNAEIDFTTLDKAVIAAQMRLNNLKSGKENADIGTGIYSDTYRKSSAKNSENNVLSKIFGNDKK